METITNYVGNEELVVISCWCGIHHAVPTSLRQVQIDDHENRKKVRSIYCPLGHQHIPGGPIETDRLRNIIASKGAHIDRLHAEIRDKNKSLSATKGVVTRMKSRAANGVCPCCKRSFQNLKRHMTTKHPKFVGQQQRRG